MTTHIDLLREGMKAIREHGHHKGSGGSPEKGFCAFGGLGHACNVCSVLGGANPITQLAMNAIHAARPSGFEGPVWEWNDLPETTKADVIVLYERAIATETAKVTNAAHNHKLAAV